MAILTALFLWLPACMSARERMQETRQSGDVVLSLSEVLSRVRLAEGEDFWFGELQRSDTQSLLAFVLAKDAVLETGYHKEHDLTMLCVRGNAIVEVEGERHLVRPPASVFIPRLHAYKILPHETEVDFVALLVFSPPFDGKDRHLVQE